MLNRINKEKLLLGLIFITTIIVRLTYVNPTDFDNFWLHGMAESINLYGHAKWVLHPASLFGFYPLSYPSALMFFFAFFSGITGLSMSSTIHFLGIFFGSFATLLTFLVGRKFGGFYVGYFGALLFSLSPQIINYSTNVASGRFMLLSFYLVFLLVLMDILHLLRLGFDSDVEIAELNYLKKSVSLKGFAKLSFAAILLLFFLFMIHRTSQFVLIFLAAAIATFVLYIIFPFWEIARHFKPLKRYFISRYKRWRFWIVFDFAILVFISVTLKFLDLLKRGRLVINYERRILPFILKVNSFASEIKIVHLIAGLILMIAFLAFLAYLIYRLKIYSFLKRTVVFASSKVAHNPKKYLFILLFIIMLYLFAIQFFGKSFYDPSIEQFGKSEFFKGSSPNILFLNFVINMITSVTVLAPFSLVGATFLFLKSNKEPKDIFMIFTLTAFAAILLDKNYVRLFITPIFTIVVAYGFINLFVYLKAKTGLNQILYLFTFFIIIIVAVSAFTPQFRQFFLNYKSGLDYREEYWNTGQYIRSLNCNCSTVTTDEQLSGVIIFASSGVPGASHNIYYYVNKSYLHMEPLSLSEIFEKLKNGQKVTELWRLPDWIYGGQYYVGRHALMLFKSSFQDRHVKRMINDYKEEYYIHDLTRDKNNFLNSIRDISNKVYSNPLTEIYHLRQGRAQI